jgi:hypothetical protein
LALVACGTRTIIDATLGADRAGETSYAHHLLGALHRGMIVLADPNFAADLVGAENREIVSEQGVQGARPTSEHRPHPCHPTHLPPDRLSRLRAAELER